MEQLMNVLTDIDNSIEWEKETALVDGRIIDSFMVIALVSELEEAFSIEIEAAEMVPKNFNSVQAIWEMVQRLQGE